MSAAALFLFVAGCDCTDETGPVRDVGESCTPSEIPAGGFDGTQTLVRRELACTDACIAHRHTGDLEPDASETPESIAANVYCTCGCGNLVCGALDDVRCPTCPDGFECCTLGADAECAPGMVSDWCVRAGTCP